MVDNDNQPVHKFLIQDLSQMQKIDECWTFKLNAVCTPLSVSQLQIQGTICKVTGFESEIVILNDGTGNVKITRGSQVPGDFSWVKQGVYCSIIGTLLDSGKLPHVAAVKMAKIENKFLEEMWPLEVAELKDFLLKKIEPKINKTSD